MNDNSKLSKSRILVVEDDENNLIIVSRLLVLAGAKAAQISKVGAYRSDMFAALDPVFDLVLLDLHLPEKDGYQIIKELQTDSRFGPSRIVALTANVMSEDLERVKKAGFHGFIGKPINAKAFGSNLERILGGEAVWEP